MHTQHTYTYTRTQVTVLKAALALEAGEVLDATYMSKEKLCAFLEAQVHLYSLTP
jgi:monomeric isocitrate dehydrogenase